jgi:hypothetical protein
MKEQLQTILKQAKEELAGIVTMPALARPQSQVFR